MPKYNGHRSWNSWNISLWMTNDESSYKYYRDMVIKHGYGKAASLLSRELAGQRTPDGAKYNPTCIREALRWIAS